MAMTIVEVNDGIDVFGRHRTGVFDLTYPNPFVAGGIPITAAEFGINRLDGMFFIGGNPASVVLLPGFDTTNSKVMLSYPTGGVAVPATVDGEIDPIIDAGAVPVLGDDATGTFQAGRGKEVDAVDMSGITVRAVVIGG